MPVLRSVIVLSVTQMVAWGAMFMFVSVTAAGMARELGLEPSMVYLGPTMMLVAMALCSPPLGALYERFGARLVLASGSAFAAPGLWLLASAHGPFTYFVAWALLGIAGAATLTTSAHVYLTEIAGEGARRAIGAQMFVMALAPSVSWPVTVFFEAALGWRGALIVYGTVMLLVCAPLHCFGLPQTKRAGRASRAALDDKRERPDTRRYWALVALIVAAVALNGFVTWGFQLVVIDIFRSYRVPDYLAVGFGSAIGFVQLSARLFDFLGGNRWDGLTTGCVAAAIMPLALIALILGAGSEWAIVLFLVLYGLSSGAMSVSRATMPLVFFSPAQYALVMARLGLPLNLAFAAAPPFFSFVLAAAGNGWALSIALLCSVGTLTSMILLNRMRPAAAYAPAFSTPSEGSISRGPAPSDASTS
ncbi:MFS transporter [Sinorhizobium americanum]|uniref:MFS permease n=1 Tax=Sinorhizobium americanum TaxID=194963 RepID=A0A1L3LML1_9HYPH|nr:MFS transporter [Sinorhizobium americanum]APG84688.1 MFS permease [Sinorhizobium americanum CCGM7]APG91342.1 MFS permease [Sinorhizobium americanum]OAP37585.1 transporter [Sinorhizobium americanum]